MPDAVFAFVSFREKWLAAQPENAVVATFLPRSQRQRAAAFGCLVYELANSAFYTRDNEAADAKLNWWAGELGEAAGGRPRHPITQELFADPVARAIAPIIWRTLAFGALAQLNAENQRDFAAQVVQAQAFYAPAARIETALVVGAADSTDAARLWTLSHLLNDVASFARGPSGERLPLPLDLLARHRASRGDLNQSNPLRTAMLREYLTAFEPELHAVNSDGAALSLARRVRARLDLALVRGARKAFDPLDHLARTHTSRWHSLWIAWREARRIGHKR